MPAALALIYYAYQTYDSHFIFMIFDQPPVHNLIHQGIFMESADGEIRNNKRLLKHSH